MVAGMKTPAYVTISAGTRIFVRTIDAIDSTQNQVGDRFQASLKNPLRGSRLPILVRSITPKLRGSRGAALSRHRRSFQPITMATLSFIDPSFSLV